MYAKRSGVVHWDLSDKNADTNEIERVAREAVEQVEGGETLIWDCLRRSGRASHPTSQHYSPEAQVIFNTPRKNRHWRLATDASIVAMGAVLSQYDDDNIEHQSVTIHVS